MRTKYITREMTVMTVVADVQNPLGGVTEVTVYLPPMDADKTKEALCDMYGKMARPIIKDSSTETKKLKCDFHDFVKNSIA